MAKNICVTFFENEEPKMSVFLAKGSTCTDIRQKWLEGSEDPASDVFFTVNRVDGDELPSEGIIDDLVMPRMPFLGVFVHSAEEKIIRVLGDTTSEPFKIKLQVKETIADLTERIKAILGIQEGRVARLLLNGRPMEAEGCAIALLSGCSTLELDLECLFAVYCVNPGHFHPLLEDAGELFVNDDLPKEVRSESANRSDLSAFPAFARSIELRRVRLFGSEPGRALAAAGDAVGEWRVTALSSDACIAGHEALYCLLTDDSLQHGAPIGVVMERRMALHVEDKLRGHQRTEAVWPTARLGDFMASSGDSVLLEGEPADPRLSLWEAGVQEGCGITLTRLAVLSIFDEMGALRLVTADMGESLPDLRQRLHFVASDQVEIWKDGEVLRNDERSLMERGIDSTSLLYALCKSRAVVLSAEGMHAVRIDAVRKGTTFPAFLQAASAALKRPLSPKTRFICDCGRVFSDESADRREFPLRCCRNPVAHLSVETPRRTRNQAQQTVWRQKKVACQADSKSVNASCQTESRSVNASCQMKVRSRRRSSQTETKVQRLIVQTQSVTRRMTTQTGGVAHFNIGWRFDFPEETFALDVPFAGALLGRDLRAAIAKTRGKKAEDLELLQCRAKRRSDGAALVDIGEENFEFVDESGRRVADGDWKDREEIVIGDAEDLVIPGELRVEIFVHRKQR